MKPENEKPHINVDFFEDLTGDISREKPGRTEGIGRRVRKLREEKGLSLEELSKLTGFEVDLLASIEADKIQPQLGTVIKLSKALDSAFSRLVSEVGDSLYSITRKADQKVVSRSTARKGSRQIYTYKSLAPEVKGRHMEALIVQLEENPEKNRSVHEGEEFIYVLNGRVVLDIGEETFRLEPGDSAYYLSTTPHLIASESGKATILAVLYGGQAPLKLLTSLKTRSFRYLWFGHLGSSMAMHADVVARSWLAWQLTGSTTSVAMANLMRAIPMLTLGLLGGVVADRFNKRTVLLIIQTWTMGIYAVMAFLVLMGKVKLWHVFAYAFLIGFGFALNQPVRTSFVPQLVNRADLLNALSIHSVATNATRLVGPAAIGFIIAVSDSVGLAYAISAGLYVTVIWTTTLLPPSLRCDEDGISFLNQFLEGFRYIFDNRLIMALVVLGIGPLAFGRSYITMLPAYVVQMLGKGSETVGLILSLAGLGAVGGGLLVASQSHIRFKGRMMLLASLLYGVLLTGFGLVKSFAVLVPLVILIGVSQVAFRTSNSSLLLELAPEKLRGRVVSVTLVDNSLGAFVAILAGIISDAAGVAAGLITMGLACLALTAFIMVYSPDLRRS